jgi:hypothetical protein
MLLAVLSMIIINGNICDKAINQCEAGSVNSASLGAATVMKIVCYCVNEKSRRNYWRCRRTL